GARGARGRGAAGARGAAEAVGTAAVRRRRLWHARLADLALPVARVRRGQLDGDVAELQLGGAERLRRLLPGEHRRPGLAGGGSLRAHRGQAGVALGPGDAPRPRLSGRVAQARERADDLKPVWRGPLEPLELERDNHSLGPPSTTALFGHHNRRYLRPRR